MLTKFTRPLPDGKRFPPRGDFVIPSRPPRGKALRRPTSADDMRELCTTIQRKCDWMRMCIEAGRYDLLDANLDGIWRCAEAIKNS